MNPIIKDSNEVYGRERSATFGVQNEKYDKVDYPGFSLANQATSQNPISNYEQYLSKYEFLRLNYENEGISQQSLLLLRRLSNSFHTEDPSLCNLPILKSMITVCKKLMLNDFEIMIWAIYLKETAKNMSDFIEYLDISALFVKKDLNEPDVFKIFETFLAHNHYETYQRYTKSSKPQVALTLRRINFYHMTLLAPFETSKDKEIQDFNYEVDALEDEHIRREVHTTKVIMDDSPSEQDVKQELVINDLSEDGNKNKKLKNGRGRGRIQPVNVLKKEINLVDDKPKFGSIKEKREAKKSFELYRDDYKSDDNSEPPQPIIPHFSGLLKDNSPIFKRKEVTSPISFNQFRPKSSDGLEKKDIPISTRFSFASPNPNLQPAIPPPYRRPIPSMESVHGLEGYENIYEQCSAQQDGHPHNIDEAGYYNILNRSIEKMPHSISREFMERANNDKFVGNVFEPFNTPFASGEFGGIFEHQNEHHRNLIHPTPKYQK